MTITAECHLCEWRGAGSIVGVTRHLNSAHGVRPDNELTVKLHAAKDYPDRSENTLGLYDAAGRLLAIVVQTAPRAADDPMGFE